MLRLIILLILKMHSNFQVDISNAKYILGTRPTKAIQKMVEHLLTNVQKKKARKRDF